MINYLKKFSLLKCEFNNNDQTYFNVFVKPRCSFSALPLEKYPNGKMFYDNTETLNKSAVLVHFNWVQGHLKMAKMNLRLNKSD